MLNMKKKTLFYSLLFAPILALTACGYGLNEIVRSDVYDSSTFVNNYYSIWDKQIDATNEDNLISKNSPDPIRLSKDLYFTTWDSPLFKAIEPNYDNYVFKELMDTGDAEIYENNVFTGKYKYGQKVKLSSIDETFKYGVISKLFDGRTFCDGATTKVRVQIAPMHDSELPGYTVDPTYKSGFGHLFEKQYEGGSPYFAFDFKGFVEMNDDMANYLGKSSPAHLANEDDCLTDVDLYISFYIKEGKEYIKKTVILEVNDISNNGKANGHIYNFVGFPLNEQTVDITECAGISIEYKLKRVHGTSVDSNEFVAKMEEFNLHHSLWLYEIFLPYSTWH